MARFYYVELPAAGTETSKAFYAKAFGFTFTDFGPDYAATMTGDTDIGINATGEHQTKYPLAVVEVDDLVAARDAVIAAGGTVSIDIFEFPGGKRFHFIDPAGHELAATKCD